MAVWQRSCRECGADYTATSFPQVFCSVRCRAEGQHRYNRENYGGRAGIRMAVLIRDKFRCRYCASAAKDGVRLEMDHVLPRSKGGKFTEVNLVAACGQCNRGKQATDTSEVLRDLSAGA